MHLLPTSKKLKTIYSLIFIFIAAVVAFFVNDTSDRNILFLAYIDIFIFAFFLYILSKQNFVRNRKEAILYTLSFMCIALLGTVIISYIYSIERTIYFSDNAFYWSKSNVFYQGLDRSFFEIIYKVYQSVLHEDYNDLVLLFLTPWIKVFGFGYKGYILSVFFAFILPALFFFVILSSNLIRNIKEYKENNVHIGGILLVVTLMIFSFSGVVYSSLIGYLDGVGLIPIMMLYLLLYKKRIQSLSVQEIIIMVILLISLPFLRRWYSYFVVSFFAAVFVTELIKNFWDKQYGLKNLIRSVFKLFIIGIGCLLVLFLFFRSFILLSIRDVGKGVYEYNNHPPLDKFIEMLNYFGLITMILVLTGAIIGVILKRTRYFAIFSILQSCFAYLLITMEQGMSPQHILLVSTGMMVLVFMNFNYVLLIKKRYANLSISKLDLCFKLLLTACLAVSTLFIANGYFTNLQTNVGKVTLLPKHTEPRVNNDIDKLTEITNFLNSVSSPSKPVYVISGSCCYDDIFNNLYLPEQKNALNYLVRSSYNDALGFPDLLFRSGFVVVVEPIASNEMTVKTTAEYFLNGRFDNYSVIKTVNLVGNTKVTIFERMRPFSNSSLQALNEMQKDFFDKYSDKKELYKFSDYRVNISKTYSGLPNVEVRLTPDKIAIHPGETNDAKSVSYIEVDSQKSLKGLSFTASMETVDKDIAKMPEAAEVYLTILGDGKQLKKEYITINNPKVFDVDISQYKKVVIQVDKGKYSNNSDTTQIKDIKFK
ncbi:hypothetical protein P5G60_18305 [Paenibacillus jamilae]|nr:hypothetical protein [Paenibacillus jamilae]